MAPELLLDIDNSWSLFLDRDGVINHEKEGDYIRNTGEFVFLKGVPEAIATLSRIFGNIFVVTNQKGVGKGLMTESDLNAIHDHMLTGIQEAGGRISAIYYCTSIDPLHPDRKPQPGMAYRAQKEFPEVDLSRSVMVGNTLSDMQFGRAAGMHTVFIRSTKPDMDPSDPAVDRVFPSLSELAKALQKTAR
jgi:histidinol-phosphate phosphatase family protein